MKLSKVRRKLGRLHFKFAPKSNFFIKLYYFLFDGSFTREMHAVYHGRLQHKAGDATLEAQRFTLRRNIHRLEKGLIMRPRKDVFALKYIGETMDAFATVFPADSGNAERTEELEWFVSVLTEYFDAIEPSKATDKHKAAFDGALSASRFACGEQRAPYQRSESPELATSFDDLSALYKRRRSVRWFEDRPAPRDLVDKAITAALQSPSACNRQPFKFRVIDSGDAVEKITSIPMGTRGYAENVPMIVVVVGQLDAYFSERDRHLIYIDSGLVGMSFILALETLGLGSCVINWPDIEEKERQMSKALSLTRWERPVMLIAVGYPDPTGGIPYSQKTPLDHARIYESPK